MNEIVVVVGATSGMGRASAERLAREGFRVVLSGRSQASVERALKGMPGEVSGYPMDFTDPESVAAFFRTSVRMTILRWWAAGRPRGDHSASCHRMP